MTLLVSRVLHPPAKAHWSVGAVFDVQCALSRISLTLASVDPISACMQDTILQLTKDLSAAQEKLLQAEQASGQRLDELEAAHAQLQVSHLLTIRIAHNPLDSPRHI